jgi:hypothetical protein
MVEEKFSVFAVFDGNGKHGHIASDFVKSEFIK